MSSNAELIEKYKSGDESAADLLVENNMGLVYSVVKKFAYCRCDNEDLTQIGAIGLIKAVKRFDTSFGVRFSTYAVPMIIGEIKRFLRDDGAIKVSRAVKELAVKGRYAEESLRRKLGRDPTVSEIAHEINAQEDDVIHAFEAVLPPHPLKGACSESGSESETLSPPEAVSNENTEDEVVDRVFLRQSLAKLSQRERKILLMRYCSGKTQSEISRIIGVSQVQISRIEKKAIERLRELAGEE